MSRRYNYRLSVSGQNQAREVSHGEYGWLWQVPRIPTDTKTYIMSTPIVFRDLEGNALDGIWTCYQHGVMLAEGNSWYEEGLDPDSGEVQTWAQDEDTLFIDSFLGPLEEGPDGNTRRPSGPLEVLPDGHFEFSVTVHQFAPIADEEEKTADTPGVIVPFVPPSPEEGDE